MNDQPLHLEPLARSPHWGARIGSWRGTAGATLLAVGLVLAASSKTRLAAAEPAAAAPARDTRAERLPPRRNLEATRVVGSPEPPPPYRVKRALPAFRVNFPISIVRQPGTELMWIVHQPKPYAPSSIGRLNVGDATGTLETLLESDETVYDLVFHPRFAENGYVYVGGNGTYVPPPPPAAKPESGKPESGKPEPAAPPAPPPEKKNRITRYTVERQPPYRLLSKSAVVILEWASNGHNGAALAFGLDGMLYITSGDGTSDSDTNLTGQGLEHLLAKVLRIDVDGAVPGQPYRVPPDNPFVNHPGARPETWAYGLRNPWRMTVDPQTGHLWVGNNGQDLWEQVYLVKKGDNYGWSVMEGSHPFYLERKAGPTPFVKPTAEHPHSESRSLTGGVVYYGQRYPELRGVYIYGDYSTGKIWGLRHDGTKTLWHRELADSTLAISGFGLDPQGELLICDHRGNQEGGYYTLEPQAPEAAELTERFPRKLSETGLFASVAGHVPHPSLIPYDVNSPLWSDGAHKERYLALVGADARIEAAGQRGWNFPNGTVIVKSFALDPPAGSTASRRWIETRLLTRQDNEWVGYSYAWNEEQTEAELVGVDGLDREFAVSTGPAGGMLKWRYPSRAECMVCHSRAANFLLGLTTAQLNRDTTYGEVQANQLLALAHWGLLAKPWPQDISKLERLVDPYDDRADLTLRARSYLHSNCSHCHVEAGGGNAQIQLEHHIPLDKLNLVDVAPMHHRFGLADARIVAPGAPERSVLLHRVTHRGTGQMPPLASQVVDQRAAQLLRDWIASLQKPPAPAPKSPSN